METVETVETAEKKWRRRRSRMGQERDGRRERQGKERRKSHEGLIEPPFDLTLGPSLSVILARRVVWGQDPLVAEEDPAYPLSRERNPPCP